MNEVEIQFLEHVLDSFYRKPQIRLLEEAEQENPPATLKEVMQKFTEFKYLTPFDFVIEIRCIFAHAEDYFSSDIKKRAIIKQFSFWFEKKIQKVPHNSLDAAKLVIRKQLKILRKVSQAMSMNSSGIITKSTTSFPGVSDLSTLQNLIVKITDVNTMREIISIFRRHGIELEPSENITIPATSLTKECVEELIEYLQH